MTKSKVKMSEPMDSKKKIDQAQSCLASLKAMLAKMIMNLMRIESNIVDRKAIQSLGSNPDLHNAEAQDLLETKLNLAIRLWN